MLGNTIGAITAEDGRFASTMSSPARRRSTSAASAIGGCDALLLSGMDVVEIHLDQDLLQLETVVVTGQATTVSSQNAANAVTVAVARK